MSTVVGGLRARLIKDSFFYMLQSHLEELGWFDSGRQHMPVALIAEPRNWDEPIEFNTLVLSAEDVNDTEEEMGSNLTEDRWTYYVDFFAEDDAVGADLAGDVRDILRGKMPTIGASRAMLRVYDYRQATPPVIAHVEIENVLLDRARNFPRPWQQHWYSVRCDLVDHYYDENVEWVPSEGEPDVVIISLVGPAGPAGPTGPQGPAGPAGDLDVEVAYVHVQESPSALWTINHPLTYEPAGVYVEDTAGNDIEGSVEYVSPGVITITFSAAFAGRAYLS